MDCPADLKLKLRVIKVLDLLLNLFPSLRLEVLTEDPGDTPALDEMFMNVNTAEDWERVQRTLESKKA